MEIFVARQPIFTAKRKIFGYELLFRSGLENVFPDVEGDTATSNVLSNTFFTFGLDEILGGKPGLVNFTETLICKRLPLLFPKEHVIIEVLEDVEPTKEVIAALKEIKSEGYRIALDDFIFDKKFAPMIQMRSIIKFDLIATPLGTLGPIIKKITEKTRLTLLAEKVETHEEFEQAKEMGFGLFQGYFFAKPEILSKKSISTTSITKLKLVNALTQSEIDLALIEELIKKDVSISFKLLKFLNSAYFSRVSEIDTVKDAMLVLGTDELKKFINVVVISDLQTNKPNELIRSSVVRARMCELCGTLLETHFTDEELFTLGLFSSMDAIMDMPMAHIMEQLSFSEKIKTALVGNDKQFKQIMLIVTNFEKGRWDHRMFEIMEGKKLLAKLPEFYRDGLKMADSFFA